MRLPAPCQGPRELVKGHNYSRLVPSCENQLASFRVGVANNHVAVGAASGSRLNHSKSAELGEVQPICLESVVQDY
jgi:hypothetical protein